MRPTLFELPVWAVIAGTAVLGAIVLFLNRKQPKKNLIIPAGMFAGALILESAVLKEPVKVPAYGFMIMVAFITGTFVAVRRAEKWGIHPDHLIDGGLCAILFGILGARILFVIQFYDEHFSGTAVTDGKEYSRVWNIFKVWQGGLVFYGGLAGAAIAIVVLLRMRKLKISLMSDLILPSVILGLAITRIGCFLNGCCFGVVTDVPWAVTFPWSSFAHEKQADDLKTFLVLRSRKLFGPDVFTGMMGPIEHAERKYGNLIDAGTDSQSFTVLKMMKQRVESTGTDLSQCSFHIRSLMSVPTEELWISPLPVHPTQLYASFTGFLIFGILLLLTKYRTFNGQIGLVFGLLYSVNRFIIEIFRGDSGKTLGMSMSQWISIALFAVSAVLYVYLSRKGECTPLPVRKTDSRTGPLKNENLQKNKKK